MSRCTLVLLMRINTLLGRRTGRDMLCSRGVRKWDEMQPQVSEDAVLRKGIVIAAPNH